MSIDINIYLRNKGGRTTRAKAKLSTKETHTSKKGATSVATKKETSHMGALATFMSSGNMMKSGVMKVPILREVMAAGKVADKGANFITAIYQARSGEQMLSNNMRAYSSNAIGLTYGEIVNETIPFNTGGILAHTLINSAFCDLNLENTETVTLRFRVNKGAGFVNTDQIETAGALRAVQIEYDSGSPFAGGEAWDLQIIYNGHTSTLASGTL